MKVFWISSSASPYKIKMFEILGKNVDLTALVINNNNELRDKSWFINEAKNVNLIIKKDVTLIELIKLMKDCDTFINSVYATKFGIMSIIIAHIFHKTSVLQADGGIAKDRGAIINFIMTKLMLMHDFFFSSSEITDRYFNYYTNKKKPILHYKFSSLFQEDVLSNNKMSLNKDDFKNSLNLNKFTFLSVGQPIYRKGFDILLKSFKYSKLDEKCNLVIIGGKPEKSSLKIIKELNINNISFIDSMPFCKLKEYYAAADSFVLCTREDIWGLVINEAISFNLPFITSDKCVSGLHFNAFHNIGTIVKNEDIQGYAKALQSAYNKKETPNYLEVSRLYTIEETATGILKALIDIQEIK